MPKIFMKVISVDSQDRHQIISYNYFLVEQNTGPYDESIMGWKPKLSTKSQMKSFFVGGCPELDDITYPMPSTEPKSLNRYGFATETAGVVRVRYNVAYQNEYRYI